ncbi:MAG: efflux RND transporter periplasmic adaptor subunit [Kiritimatiellae bacterium]|nr:efflux RND transporter periplasmic adaptor subunit [Kiritimatiellia bacterium]
MKRTILLVVVLLLLAGIGWRVRQKIAEKRRGTGLREQTEPMVAVVLKPVKRQEIRDTRAFVGTVLPRSRFLVAPKIAGRLERRLVDIGQTVTNGQLVALLDGQEYAQQVQQARAELDVAKANVAETRSALDLAERELERVRDLRSQKIVSESELEQTEVRYRAAAAKHDVSLAQVQQREAALKGDEVRFAYTRIAAMWEGEATAPRVVGERFVDEGDMLRANDPIASILETDVVLAVIYVIEQDYPRIAIGQAALLTTDAFAGRVFAGKVVRLAPMLKESSRQARVEIEVPNPERRLAPGMFARVEIEFARHADATVAPLEALVRRNGRSGVFVADRQAMRARFVPVTVGIARDDLVEIVAPPLAGEVVVTGQHLLDDGGAIAIPESASAAPGGQSTLPAAKERP